MEDLEIAGKQTKTCTRRTQVEGMGYVNVCKGVIGGLTIAKFKEFRDNINENMAKMDPGVVKGTKLADIEGCSMVNMTQITTPFIMSNRCLFNAFYF